MKANRSEILQIVAIHAAYNVSIFGSVARGEADSSSDIDLLVKFEPGVILLGHAAMIQELKDLLGAKVNIVSERCLREWIKERILREAVALGFVCANAACIIQSHYV